MKYFIIFFTVLLNCSVFAQSSVKEKEFINQIITEHNITYQDSISKQGGSMLRNVLMHTSRIVVYKLKEDSVIYADSEGKKTRMLRSKAQPIILNEMSGGRFTLSRLISIPDDSLIFSQQEVTYMLEQFEKMSDRKWDTNLIAGTKQISKDTINMIFKNPRSDGWGELHKRGVNSFSSFGPPVFIRDGAYCIFYSDNSCGFLCGSGKLAVYQNENGKWTYWGTISSWIS